MTPQLLTYILFFVPLGMLLFEFRTYHVNKKNGQGTAFRPLQTIAAFVVMCLALYAILTGQTYDDILAMFR